MPSKKSRNRFRGFRRAQHADLDSSNVEIVHQRFQSLSDDPALNGVNAFDALRGLHRQSGDAGHPVTAMRGNGLDIGGKYPAGRRSVNSDYEEDQLPLRPLTRHSPINLS